VTLVGVIEPGPARSEQPNSWSLSLAFAPDSVPRARRDLARVLNSYDVPDTVIDDACAVLSELLANAIRHARPRSHGRVDIDVTIDDQQVRLEVADGGSLTIPSLVSPTQTSVNGRGLSIVHSLTSDWGVRERADGNTVFGILSRT
jgi:anti-sigma regulatory factor (Ser/Thr protein kinase)